MASDMPMDRSNLGDTGPGDFPGLMERPEPDEVFPFPSYREHQEDILRQARAALYGGNDVEVVIIDAPTGIGKSPMNTALGLMAGEAHGGGKAFMTTPQRSLREQLGQDEDLNDHYSVLKGRPDYQCGPGGARARGPDAPDCSECPIYNSDESCMDQQCPYWMAKDDAMYDDIAVLTFAYLVIDSYVPVYPPEGQKQISFDDRELLIVDEAHTLDDQVASLFAGFKLSPWTLPDEVYQRGVVDDRVNDEMTRVSEVEEVLNDLYDRAEQYIMKHDSSQDPDIKSNVEDCEEFIRKLKWVRDERREGLPWVVNVATGEDGVIDSEGRERATVELKPVDVANFLKAHVWSRADKIVLSTATMPYRGDPKKWLRELGLPDDENKFEVISKPMAFPVQNRPIVTTEAIAPMSSGGFWDNVDAIAGKLRRLSKRHDGQKGLIHTSSYDQAQTLGDELGPLAVVHDQEGADPQDQLNAWYHSDEPMFISPSCKEGVDLEGDHCRWQALAKVPYPNIGDSRWDYRLNERYDWDAYTTTTALDCIQAVGRGVRAGDDWCVFYVLDEKFTDLRQQATLPDWYEAAIDPDFPTVADDESHAVDASMTG